MGKKIARIVFDTNIIISALLFNQGSLTFLREKWSSLEIIPLVSKDTTEELLRVFNYPKFKLSNEAQKELLSDYLPYAEIIIINDTINELPLCRDKHDQKFLELALSGKADFLVTGDNDLLVLNNDTDFPIISVKDWLEIQ